MNRSFGRLARAALDLRATTDGQLLTDFVARRDDAAFAGLVRRHGSMVLAVCRRVLRHQQDAEDAFQATFLVLARKAEDVWPREAVGAWLHGVAYRVAMKARGVRAKLARREHPLEDTPQLPPEPPCPDLAAVLDRAIRKLPEVYRAAVVACDLEGRTRKDAAEQLGWKEGTLSGRLSRARQLLAVRLKNMGLVVPVGGLMCSNTADAVPPVLAGSHVAVSAPVAALTEGVVRSMFLVKTKMIAVTVFATCAMGLGVWSATGQGPGEGGKGLPRPTSKLAGTPPKAEVPSKSQELIELAQQELQLLIAEASLKPNAAETPQDRENRIVCLQSRIDSATHLLNLARPLVAQPPKPKLAAEVAQAKVAVAERKLKEAHDWLDEVTAQAQVATIRVAMSDQSLRDARDKLAALKQAGEKPPAAKGESFTLHIRTQFAAETVTTVKLVGNEAVLDVVSTGVDVKLRQTASIWIVRDGKLLPVDLDGITRNGLTKTNYQIMDGDKLFVQVNVGK